MDKDREEVLMGIRPEMYPGQRKILEENRRLENRIKILDRGLIIIIGIPIILIIVELIKSAT